MDRSSTKTPTGDAITEGKNLLGRWMTLNQRKRQLLEMWNDMETHSRVVEFQLAETIKLIDEVKEDIAKYNRFNGCYFYDGDE